MTVPYAIPDVEEHTAARHVGKVAPLRRSPGSLEGYQSAGRGQYRVVYSIHDDEVLVRVVCIPHHPGAYG